MRLFRCGRIVSAQNNIHAHPGFRLMSRCFKVTERRTRSFGLLATKRRVRLIIGRTAAHRVEKFRFTFVSGMSILLYCTIHTTCVRFTPIRITKHSVLSLRCRRFLGMRLRALETEKFHSAAKILQRGQIYIASIVMIGVKLLKIHIFSPFRMPFSF